jgi:hypothetical protein
MAALLASLRTGAWLTRERTRLIGFAVLFASMLGIAFLVATADGNVDRQGRPLGTDFSNVYAAGTYVLEGRPVAPFEPSLQHAREREIFGAGTPFYGWHYPPFFLFVAALLALLPYGLALLVWQAATFMLYLVTIRAILTMPAPAAVQERPAVDPLWLLLAAAYPAVLVNVGHGHNGFLTAALLGGALVLLDRRPAVAGVLLGLLAYKPQFGLLIPLVLAATGRWRTFGFAAITVAALAIASTAAFGPEVWSAFLASTEFTRTVILERGDTGWHKIQSVFSWVRMWGGSVTLAYAAQAGVTIALGIALVRLWRRPRPYPLQAAGLAIAAVLATPYCLDYDMVALAPAIAFFVADGLRRGFGPMEKTALAVLWFIPLVARTVAEWTLVPVGILAMVVMFALTIARAERSAAGVPHKAPLVTRGTFYSS